MAKDIVENPTLEKMEISTDLKFSTKKVASKAEENINEFNSERIAAGGYNEDGVILNSKDPYFNKSINEINRDHGSERVRVKFFDEVEITSDVIRQLPNSRTFEPGIRQNGSPHYNGMHNPPSLINFSSILNLSGNTNRRSLAQKVTDFYFELDNPDNDVVVQHIDNPEVSTLLYPTVDAIGEKGDPRDNNSHNYNNNIEIHWARGNTHFANEEDGFGIDQHSYKTIRSFDRIMKNVQSYRFDRDFSFIDLLNNPEIVATLVYEDSQIGTFLRIIIDCLKGIVEGNSTYYSKLGFSDTLVNIIKSMSLAKLRMFTTKLTDLQRFVSEIPYNKMVMEEWNKFKRSGFLSSNDPSYVLNPIVSRIFELSFDFDLLSLHGNNRDRQFSNVLSKPSLRLPSFSAHSFINNIILRVPASTDGRNRDSLHGFNRAVNNGRNKLTLSYGRSTDLLLSIMGNEADFSYFINQLRIWTVDRKQFYEFVKQKKLLEGTVFDFNVPEIIDIMNRKNEPLTTFSSNGMSFQELFYSLRLIPEINDFEFMRLHTDITISREISSMDNGILFFSSQGGDHRVFLTNSVIIPLYDPADGTANGYKLLALPGMDLAQSDRLFRNRLFGPMYNMVSNSYLFVNYAHVRNAVFNYTGANRYYPFPYFHNSQDDIQLDMGLLDMFSFNNLGLANNTPSYRYVMEEYKAQYLRTTYNSSKDYMFAPIIRVSYEYLREKPRAYFQNGHIFFSND